MRVPMQWLGEFVADLPDAGSIATALTMGGVEAEVVPPALADDGAVVVARIEDASAHPNADRLTLCMVNDGSCVRPVVCGATNMKTGDTVVLARPGAVLPGGMKIKKAKLRGVASEGMLCAAAELGMPAGGEGILLLQDGVELGTSATELLGLAEPGLELSLTPNRGDCLSLRGVAREVSAVTGCELTPAFDNYRAVAAGTCDFEVLIDDLSGCTLYRGLQVKAVSIKASPLWLCARLAQCGLRPVNNVVDVTNLVLMELGQPLHAFDADLLTGSTIRVATVEAGIEFASLDGESRALEAGDMVIADEQGPVAVAGVMGGQSTAVHEGTTNLFLEAAIFAPARVRRTSRRLGLISDSSYRFERGIDASLVEKALTRAAELIMELAGGTISGGIVEAGQTPTAREAIRFRHARLNALLGDEVPAEESRNALERLGMQVSADDDQALAVVPPAHRHDIQREVDLVEEVIRLRGYDRIPTELPGVVMGVVSKPRSHEVQRILRQQLSAGGMSEAVGLSFCASVTNQRLPGLHAPSVSAMRVRNPLRADENEMRRSGLATLLEACRSNLRLGREVVDLFSLARTFSYGSDPQEIDVLAGLLAGPRRARGPGQAGPPTVWDAKGVVQRALGSIARQVAIAWEPCEARPEYHPRGCASVLVGGRCVGYLGRIHPELAEHTEVPEDVTLFEVDYLLALDYCAPPVETQALGKFPSSRRDVSFLAPEGFLSDKVVQAVLAINEPMIESVTIFDEYSGTGVPDGSKALAYALVYRSPERTLTDDQVASLHERAVAHVVDTLQLQVRA